VSSGLFILLVRCCAFVLDVEATKVSWGSVHESLKVLWLFVSSKIKVLATEDADGDDGDESLVI
jgi:hypothetical protein